MYQFSSEQVLSGNKVQFVRRNRADSPDFNPTTKASLCSSARHISRARATTGGPDVVFDSSADKTMYT